MISVSIIVCAYKTGERILPTLHSILDQSFTDFELIIIDDASKDDTSEAIKTIKDYRIKLKINSTNLGVAASRNLGNDIAKGAYIAHCDHDDIWETTKLEKQVHFLDTHSSYGLVSTKLKKYLHGAPVVDESPLRDLATPNEIRWSLLLDSTFAHSATVYRSSIIKQYDLSYSTDYTFADDWDFFVQISKVTDTAIIPEPLTQYHLGHDNWSIQAAGKMLLGGEKLCFRELSLLLPSTMAKKNARLFFRTCVSGSPCESRSQLREMGDILFQLEAAFESSKVLSNTEKENIRELASYYWWRLVTKTANERGPYYFTLFKSHKVPKWVHVNGFFLAKALLIATIKTIARLTKF